MSLFRRLFYRKPPDHLLEISDRVYVFDCCFSLEILPEDDYNAYFGGIVAQLHDYSPEASFMVFNFRDGGGQRRSRISDILSEYDMTVMDYPRHYEGCPLLPLEMVHHFLRSSESWLSLEGRNVVLVLCERGGWPVLAFMLAGLLLYRKQYVGERKTLEMVYKQAPKELLQLLSPLDPKPSQLRYLQYITRCGGGLVDKPFILDCLVLRFVPNFDGKGGCRPTVRVYGQDHLNSANRSSTILFSTPGTKKQYWFDKQEESGAVKLPIRCHVQGDVVLECIHIDEDLEREEMMFRVMFNTAFFPAGALLMGREEIDVVWNAKDQFPKGFEAEVLFSELEPVKSETTKALEEIFSSVELQDAKSNSIIHIVNTTEQDEGSHFSNVNNLADEMSGGGESHNDEEDIEINISLKQGTADRVGVKNSLDQADIVAEKLITLNTLVSVGAKNTLDMNKFIQDTEPITSQPAEKKRMSETSNFQKNALSISIFSSCDVSHKLESSTLSNDEEYGFESSKPKRVAGSAIIKERFSLGSKSQYSCENNIEHDSREELQDHVIKRDADNIAQHNLETCSMSEVENLEDQALGNSQMGNSIYDKDIGMKKPVGDMILVEEKNVAEIVNINQEKKDTVTIVVEQKAMADSGNFKQDKEIVGAQDAVELETSDEAQSRLRRRASKLNSDNITSRNKSITEDKNPKLVPSNMVKKTHDSKSNTEKGLIQNKIESKPINQKIEPDIQDKNPEKSLPTVSKKPSMSAKPPSDPVVSKQKTLPPSPGGHEGPPPIQPPYGGSAGAPLPPTPAGGCAGVPLSQPLPGGHSRAPPPPPPPGARAPGPPAPPKAPGAPPPPSSRSGLTRLGGSSLYTTGPRRSSFKPLHWVKVSKAIQGSLWAELQKYDDAPSTSEFDVSELEHLFSAAVSKSDGHRKSLGSKSDKVHLIDIRRANIIGIMLTKVKMPLPDLMSAVLALDDSVLDIDQVENLIKFCPTEEEIKLLEGYTGDKKNLGKCEQFFLELMEVPRVELKLRVFAFKIQFGSQVSDLKKSLNTVDSASEQIRNSVKLKEIMKKILSLGNILNQGTARGSAIGFGLDSLLKLSDTRATNNNMTLMHYLCKTLATKSPHLLDFHEDLVSLEAASKIQLKSLAEEIQAMVKGLEKVEQELIASESDGPVSEVFRKNLKEFTAAVGAEVQSLSALCSAMVSNVKALIQYFGEHPARCPFEQFQQVISTLSNFVSMFRLAHKENCKQIEIERKRAEKGIVIENPKVSKSTSKNDSRSINLSQQLQQSLEKSKAASRRETGVRR